MKKHTFLRNIGLCLSVVAVCSCSSKNTSTPNESKTTIDTDSVKMEVKNIVVDSMDIYRANFRKMLHDVGPVTYPFKMDMSMDGRSKIEHLHHKYFDLVFDPFYKNEHMIYADEKKFGSQKTENPFFQMTTVLGYLPDTTDHFTLLGLNTEADEPSGLIMTFDKNCLLIDMAYVKNHSSDPGMSDIVLCEDYFTVDKDLKLHYYYHLKTRYEDDCEDCDTTEGPVEPMVMDEESEYVNDGYIDKKGLIHFSTKTEKKLK